MQEIEICSITQNYYLFIACVHFTRSLRVWVFDPCSTTCHGVLKSYWFLSKVATQVCYHRKCQSRTWSIIIHSIQWAHDPHKWHLSCLSLLVPQAFEPCKDCLHSLLSSFIPLYKLTLCCHAHCCSGMLFTVKGRSHTSMRSPGLAASTMVLYKQRLTVWGVSPSGIASGVSCSRTICLFAKLPVTEVVVHAMEKSEICKYKELSLLFYCPPSKLDDRL